METTWCDWKENAVVSGPRRAAGRVGASVERAERLRRRALSNWPFTTAGCTGVRAFPSRSPVENRKQKTRRSRRVDWPARSVVTVLVTGRVQRVPANSNSGPTDRRQTLRTVDGVSYFSLWRRFHKTILRL